MWMSLIENAEDLKEIYKGVEPSLENVEIIKIEIVSHEFIDVIIVLQLLELPEELPPDWKSREIDAVALEFNFLSVEIHKFRLLNGNSEYGNLLIEAMDNNKKSIRFFDKNGKEIFVIDANWIFIQSFSAYKLITEEDAI